MGGASLAKIRTLWCGSQPGAPTYLSTNPNPLPWQLPPTPVAGVQEYIPGVVKCRRQKQVLSARASLTGLAGREDLPQRCQVSQHGYRNGRRNSGHRGNGNPPPPPAPSPKSHAGRKRRSPQTGTCLLARDSTAVTTYQSTLQHETEAHSDESAWAGLHLDGQCLDVHNLGSLFKTQSYCRTLKMDLGALLGLFSL